MKTVSVTELKAHLSKYLRVVRRGGEVQILERGVPIARITGVASGGSTEEAAIRQRLIAAGVIRSGSGDASAILALPPLEWPADLREALEEERSDRL
jgi:prevent-host-death family protein